MRTKVIKYRCDVKQSKIELRLEEWSVAWYPISFTVEECLEEFCELVGWEFLGYHKNVFSCRVPNDRLVMDTIYARNEYYRQRVRAGTA